MDLEALVANTNTSCEALALKADTVIKLWAEAKNVQEEREQGNITKKDLIQELWEKRHNMQLNLGRLSFEMGMLHTFINDALAKLVYTDAKQALLERTLKPLIQTQEVINRAQAAADMVSQMLQNAVE